MTKELTVFWNVAVLTCLKVSLPGILKIRENQQNNHSERPLGA